MRALTVMETQVWDGALQQAIFPSSIEGEHQILALLGLDPFRIKRITLRAIDLKGKALVFNAWVYSTGSLVAGYTEDALMVENDVTELPISDCIRTVRWGHLLGYWWMALNSPRSAPPNLSETKLIVELEVVP